MTRLNYANQTRDSVLAADSPEKAAKIYQALKCLDQLAYDPNNMILRKLDEGKLLFKDSKSIPS